MRATSAAPGAPPPPPRPGGWLNARARTRARSRAASAARPTLFFSPRAHALALAASAARPTLLYFFPGAAILFFLRTRSAATRLRARAARPQAPALETSVRAAAVPAAAAVSVVRADGSRTLVDVDAPIASLVASSHGLGVERRMRSGPWVLQRLVLDGAAIECAGADPRKAMAGRW